MILVVSWDWVGTKFDVGVLGPGCEWMDSLESIEMDGDWWEVEVDEVGEDCGVESESDSKEIGGEGVVWQVVEYLVKVNVEVIVGEVKYLVQGWMMGWYL